MCDCACSAVAKALVGILGGVLATLYPGSLLLGRLLRLPKSKDPGYEVGVLVQVSVKRVA